MSQTRFAIVDCNNFYAACERVFKPFLSDQPVVVLSNNDGCIIARSAEAKALGIEMGVPLFKVRSIIEANQVQVFSSNYALYADMSDRVMTSIKQFVNEVEIYSIDEAFLRFTDTTESDIIKISHALRHAIYQWTGIPVSIGIGATKTLSKIANRFAKTTHSGIYALPDHCNLLLDDMEIESIWGISKGWGTRLRTMGIHTGLQLKTTPTMPIRQRFGIVLERVIHELNGTVCIDLDPTPSPKKTITCTRSFGCRIELLPQLECALSAYVARACEKLRQQGGVAGRITVFLWGYVNQNRNQRYTRHHTCLLQTQTSDTRVITTAAKSLLAPLYQPGIQYKKCGIMLSEIVSSQSVQPALFRPTQRGHVSTPLMTAIDAINHKMGRHTIYLASQGAMNRPQGWQSKQSHQSPCYTTNWKQLPIAY